MATIAIRQLPSTHFGGTILGHPLEVEQECGFVVGFSIIHPTASGHDVDATRGGFSAVLSSGGVVQLENEFSAAGADARLMSRSETGDGVHGW